MEMPLKPNFESLTSNKSRFERFGYFKYQILAGGDIIIQGNWIKNNICKLPIPLDPLKVKNFPKDKLVYFHKLVIPSLLYMFEEWERNDLLKYIITWEGSFYPRLVRGGTSLSNHAFGSAFDINAKWNGYGNEPCKNIFGTVIPLVEIANKHGWFWGGHYLKKKDGMHFEKVFFNDIGV